MIILPAIDLLDGKVVRLTQGKRDQVTVYSDDPLAVARRWKEQGAQWLHVVDLNGAFEGTYKNLDLAERIIRESGMQVELSGGIRSKETLSRCLAAGAGRIILGTKACEDPAFIQEAADRYGHKIAVAIDAKAGQVVSRGWVAPTGVSAPQLARSVVMLGVEMIVCTDVGRDGTLSGPNLGLLEDVLAAGARSVIASGGVSSIKDLEQLKTLEPKGVIGVIIGKALYEGTVELKEALTVAEAGEGKRNKDVR
ncbi:MAG: 1-(5-phosphoribosyl)-5-[(5-phosphoribosylamino)methylideneamino]imidazole-4-carboxamide isomerase [Candidatus Omnitrophica bacterium]|nr:1-(5-phosphoribosyl)-5-[(5-phosphoribosylamino)methylideneamino]imidazole-4-carboxamide isomerase [Candidatus Omnitrophota bacterium]